MPVAREGPSLGILLLLGCALGAAGAAHLQHHCKKTLRTLAFERCAGYREKRSPTPSTGGIEESQARKKRQIMSIREIIVSARVPIHDVAPKPAVRGSARHESASIVSPGESAIYKPTKRFEPLPKESSGHLGHLDLGDVEIEETTIGLLSEIYERIPRSPAKTREESMREFVALAYECCPRAILPILFYLLQL